MLASGHPSLEGITYERLVEEGWVRLNYATPFVPFTDGFPTPSGKLEFVSSRAQEDGYDPVAGYTPPREAASRTGLALLAPASHWFLNSTFANHPLLRERAGGPKIEVHPDDAQLRGLQTGDEARVFNARGEFIAVVEVSDRVRPGVIASTKGHWLKHVRGGANPNATVDERDADMGRGAVFHDNRVEVEALERPRAPADAEGLGASASGWSAGPGDGPHADARRLRDVRAGRALAPEEVVDVGHAAGGDVAHRAIDAAGRLLVDRHLRPRLLDLQGRADRDPEDLVGEQVLGEAAAGPAADALRVGVEAVEDVQAVDRPAPAAEVVVRARRVTQHLAGLEHQPLEVAVAPVGIRRGDAAVVVRRVLEREASRVAVARVPLGVHVVGEVAVVAAERGLLEVLLPGVGAAPVERGRDALGRHHVLEADRRVLRALPLVDGLLDADVGRADRELAEAAAAGRGLDRDAAVAVEVGGGRRGHAVRVGDLERDGLALRVRVARGALVLDVRIADGGEHRGRRRPLVRVRPGAAGRLGVAADHGVLERDRERGLRPGALHGRDLAVGLRARPGRRVARVDREDLLDAALARGVGRRQCGEQIAERRRALAHVVRVQRGTLLDRLVGGDDRHRLAALDLAQRRRELRHAAVARERDPQLRALAVGRQAAERELVGDGRVERVLVGRLAVAVGERELRVRNARLRLQIRAQADDRQQPRGLAGGRRVRQRADRLQRLQVERLRLRRAAGLVLAGLELLLRHL